MPHHAESYFEAARLVRSSPLRNTPSLSERDRYFHNFHALGHGDHHHMRGKVVPTYVEFVDDLGKSLNSDCSERASDISQSNPTPMLHVEELDLHHLGEEQVSPNEEPVHL